MTNYTCSKRNKTFDRKNNYEFHINRKNPCIPYPNKIEILDIKNKELENRINILEEKLEQLLLQNGKHDKKNISEAKKYSD